MSDISRQIANLSPEQLKKLAEKLELLRKKPEGPDQPVSPVPERGPVIPARPLTVEGQILSPAQERLWLLHQLDTSKAVYSLTLAFRLKGSLDIAHLEKSINRLVTRHQVLRTTFKISNEETRQVVASKLHIPLNVTNLAALSQNKREARVTELASEQASQGFNLETGPLLRASLIRLTEYEHVLLVTVHQNVADIFSLEIFGRELAALYQASLQDSPSLLSPLPIQYADYAAWQREQLQGGFYAKSLDYWKNRLAGAPAVLELPKDMPRPALPSYRSDCAGRVISAQLAQKLVELSQQAGVSLFSTLTAAFKVLLHRYTGQSDLVIGTRVANRYPAQTSGLIGPFANFMAWRTSWEGNPTFLKLLSQIDRTAQEDFAHQNLPFEQLIEALNPKRELSHAPIFQILLELYEKPSNVIRLDAGELELRPFLIESEAAIFDLALIFAREENGELALKLRYSTDLFMTDTMERLLDHLENLLESVTTRPEQHLSEINLIGEQELRRLLVDWNETSQKFPTGQSMHQLFEEQVTRTPEATALVWQEQRLTYRELNERSNQVAHFLRELGVGPESLIGLCVERSVEMIVGLLGILKAGGAYVPLDPVYPAERLGFILEDAQAKIVITQAHLVERLPANLPARLVKLDSDWAEIARQSAANPADTADKAGRLAYLIYTSGSTGRPKGVAIEHRNAVTFIHWANTVYGPEEWAGVLASTSICFDLSVFEIFATLAWGGKIILAKNALELPRLAARHEVRLINTVPSAIAELLREKGLPASVRTVNLAGEPLPNRLAQQIYEQNNQVKMVYNLYGPSEDTTYSTYTLVPKGSQKPVHIGRPIANSQVYLLDKYLQPVPQGVPGEIYLGGEGLARGYLNRPELTTEKFIPNPFSAGPGSRLYRTGDLARYLPDGNLEYLGRIDHQVKVRGFRIELGEIEEVLNAHVSIREALVLAREDTPGDKRLVAYLVAVGQAGAVTSADLRAYLKARLPEYMIPSAFVSLEQFPLTPNGKIDRKALPAPEIGLNQELEQHYIEPRTPAEKVLASLFGEVLGLKRVGLEDNFFELGGHSLLAARLMARILEAFQIELALHNLFEAPTIARLVERIEQLKQAASEKEAPAIVALARPPRYTVPLSFTQKRLWFIDQLNPGTGSYYISRGIRLKGPVKIAALKQSIHEIVRRHDSLRTTFTTLDEQPVQQVISYEEWLQTAGKLVFDEMDLQGYTPEQQETEVTRLVLEHAHLFLNLRTGPLIQFRLLHLGPSHFVLLITMHHIISDGWSLGIMVREMTVLYQAFSRGKPSPLAELPVQYADYVSWQYRWMQGEVLEEQMAYWRRQLAGVPPALELPTDHPRPPEPTFRGSEVQRTLPLELCKELAALNRRAGVTMFMTLLAAFKVLLYRYTGQTDLVVGVPTANRTRTETERLIGFFTNSLVYRTNLAGQPTFLETLERVREISLGAFSHQDLPIEQFVTDLRPTRVMSHAPIYQVMFALQNTPLWSEAVALGDIQISQLNVPREQSKFDLELYFLETPSGELRASIIYSLDLFEKASMERLLGHLQTILESAVADSAQPVSHLNLLPPPERRQLVEGWNQTAKAYPLEQTITSLVEQQVERTPAAVAAVFEQEKLTYRELNERANRLAHYLRKQGVGPEVRVGLSLERSLDMIVGMLAIMKAGGAYVPLDPSYPLARLHFMLEDSQAQLILTQSRLVNQLPGGIKQLVCLDSDWERIAAEPATNPPNLIQPHNLLYIIYTSGSTGQLKGVLVEHRSLVNAFHTWKEVYELRKLKSHLQMASLSFDVSFANFVRALGSGGKLVQCPQEVLLDAPRLYELIRREEVDIAEFVPAVLRNLIAYLEETGQDLSSLKLVAAGADSWYVHEYQSFRRFCGPDTRLINSYGLTETSIDSTYFEGDTTGLAAEGLVPLGRPFGNTKVYILDAALQTTPVGVPGEIYIGGLAVARGYLNRPDLTALKFIPDPFSAEPGSRLCRTGDRGRYLADGTIEFLGRLDYQIKIRGFRIELGEIEATLRQHPLIQDGVVLAIDPESLASGAEKPEVSTSVPAGPASFKTPPIQARPRFEETLLPLSFAQQRMWFICELLPSNATYNIPAALHLRGRLNLEALQQALSELVSRQEMLRATFPVVDGQPVQRITAPHLAPIPALNPIDLAVSEWEGVAREEAATPFDLANGPLFRARLLRLAETDHLLLLTMHHIMSDGWSMGLLVRELSTIYGALVSGEAVTLPALAFQYADYAAWQREEWHEELADQEQGYWRQQLAGAPPTSTLPTDRPRSTESNQLQGAEQSLILPAKLTGQIHALSQNLEAGLFPTLLAAFKTLLYSQTGQTDLVVGTTVANREKPGFDRLIGFMVNSLALRTRLNGNLSFKELVERVKQTFDAACDHQELPFEKVLDGLNVQRLPGYPPLYQTLFILQPDLLGAASLKSGELEISPTRLASQISKFDLTLYFEEKPEGLKVTAIYDTDLFEATTIGGLLQQLQIILEKVITRPETALSELAGPVQNAGSQPAANLPTPHKPASTAQKADKRLVAYYVPVTEKAASDQRELRAYLKEKLPDYMIPSAFICLEELPLTPNAKLDLKALPRPTLDNAENYVAPRNELEARLVNLWEGLLKVNPIGVSDNFFDLGGHSLLLVQLVSRIEEALGMKIPIATIYRHPTIEQLVAELGQMSHTGSFSPLVAIKPEGSCPPLFCVHPVGGSVDAFRRLAMYLPDDQPFYALQSPGLSGEQAPLSSIEVMAGCYIEALRTKQPHGPYYLAGWSMGGLIALEMAQQLQKSGEDVALVALMDSAYYPEVKPDDPSIFHAKLFAAYARREGVPVDYAALCRLNADQQLDYVLENTPDSLLQSRLGGNRELLRQLLKVMLTNAQALMNYRPAIYQGRLVLLKARDHDPSEDDPELALAESSFDWSRYSLHNLEIYPVAGDHETIMEEPNVEALAQALERCLSSAPLAEANI